VIFSFLKNIQKTLVLAVLIAFIFLFLALPVRAQSTFGGRILWTFPCTNGGLALVIGPPKGGLFLYQLGVADLYREYQVRIVPWVLGNYTSGGVCVVGVPPFGFTLYTKGTIHPIGTSFF